jgi:anti-sigma regulatory factor (Ser/Thr protein kinase)
MVDTNMEAEAGTDDVNQLLSGIRTNFKFVCLALPRNAAFARAEVERYLASICMTEDDKFAMNLAAGEAIINSCEHAYKGQEPGKVYIRGFVNGNDGAVIEIEDAGIWTGIPSEHTDDNVFSLRGRGIELMMSLADKVRFYSKVDGGTVVIISKLFRPIMAA